MFKPEHGVVKVTELDVGDLRLNQRPHPPEEMRHQSEGVNLQHQILHFRFKVLVSMVTRLTSGGSAGSGMISLQVSGAERPLLVLIGIIL